MYSFHNLWYLYEVLPRELTEIKLNFEDRKQYHFQIVRKMREQVAQAKRKRKRNVSEDGEELDIESQQQQPSAAMED